MREYNFDQVEFHLPLATPRTSSNIYPNIQQDTRLGLQNKQKEL